MNFKNWMYMATKELVQSDENSRRVAEILLEHVTGKTRTWILAFNETILTKEQMKQLSILLARRKKGEPVAYLTGECEFWSLPISVSPSTLIPRPDTECLVEQVLTHLPSSRCRILDLGTGTGAIALALAFERPDCQVTAVDVISDALHLARCNATRLEILNVQVVKSNWFDTLAKQMFDVIVSNPPYIDKNDPYLLQGDLLFEPRTSLVAAEKGLADIRYIIIASRQHLHVGGWLLIEHGWSQGATVRMLFIESGFCDIETCCDYGGNDRLTLGRLK